MTCKHDGMGSFVGFTVTKDGQCRTTSDASNVIASAQLLIQQHTAARTAALLIKQKDAPEWTAELDQFQSPNTADGPGTFENMRFGQIWHHSEIPVNFLWPWESDFNLSFLMGAEGTLRLTNPDASYWEGKAKVVRAPMQPNRTPGEDAMGQIVWRWFGGANQPAYTGP